MEEIGDSSEVKLGRGIYREEVGNEIHLTRGRGLKKSVDI